MSELEVSDVYVRLGNDFNAAVAAFGQFNIDMRYVFVKFLIRFSYTNGPRSELVSVPDDLRNILETCLAEDATPANLDVYLPDVRKIITNLLQGLRSKQSVYRRTISDRSRQSSSSNQGDSPRMRDSKVSVRSTHERTRSGRGEREPRQSTHRKDPISESQTRAIAPSDDSEWIGGFSTTPRGGLPSAPNVPLSNHPSWRQQSSNNSGYTTPRQDLPPPVEEEEEIIATPAERLTESPPPVPQAPPNMIRYSLSDRPVPPSPPTMILQDTRPSFVLDTTSPAASDTNLVAVDAEHNLVPKNDIIHPTSPSVGTEQDLDMPMDAIRAPAMESSLAALKKSDALERRASKRFSTYTFSKMTGTRDKGISALDKLVGGGDDRRRNRRSAAFGGNLTPGDLESLAEENESPLKSVRPSRSNRSDSSSSGSRKPAMGYASGEEPPPVPPMPESITPATTAELAFTPEPGAPEPMGLLTPPTSIAKPPPESSTLGLQTVTIFLKLGLQVKKAKLDRDGLSIPSLRLQFTEKFSYNPGMENFPAIYINDPSSHIQYELEDMDEIKDKSLLSLNIEREHFSCP